MNDHEFLKYILTLCNGGPYVFLNFEDRVRLQMLSGYHHTTLEVEAPMNMYAYVPSEIRTAVAAGEERVVECIARLVRK